MSDSYDWWTEFFLGPFLDAQLGMPTVEATLREVDALVGALDLATSHRILDVPCGTGRHSLELARRGYRLTGVDFNPAVLDVARAAAAAEGLSIDFHQGDMRALGFAAQFERAFCHWGSFGYFSDAENQSFLDGVGRALCPGGRFFLDLHVAETLYPKATKRDFFYVGADDQRLRVLEERRFDHDSGRIESTWTFQKKGQEESRSLSIRIYTYRELRSMFEAAGLRVVSATDKDERPFELGSSRLWLVTEKA